MAKDLELPVARRNGDQARERVVVARKAREETVPEVGARGRDPRAIRQEGTLPDAVIPGVVDDAAVGRRLAHPAAAQRLDPIGDWAATTHRIDDDVGANRAITGPNAGHARYVASRPVQPDHLDARPHHDARLMKHRPAKAPLDKRASDAEDLELRILGS